MTPAGFCLSGGLAEQLRTYQARRLGELDTVLGTVLPETAEELARLDQPLRYAVAHQVLGAVEGVALSGGDGRQLAELGRRCSRIAPVSTAVGPVLAARAAPRLPAEDAGTAQPPPSMLDADAMAGFEPDRRRDDQVRRGMIATVEAGFGGLATGHSRVLVLLRDRALGETARSWTTARFPGTVHTDVHEPIELFARDVVHEAAHSCLNELLMATQVQLPETPGFYSPWKRTARPPFGFLHSVWAFANVLIFLRWLTGGSVLQHQEHALVATLTDRLHTELGSTSDDLAPALALVPEPELRDLIRTRREQALDVES